ncbi:MAG: c-type cytochrome, partial [Gammaproteobacteria bacterium]
QFILAGFLGAVLGAAAAQDAPLVAGDAAAGKTLYEGQCLVCHGVGGASVVPTQPVLAGQYAEYTAAELKKFRDGTRVNAVMAPMGANLSDADIADLSAYLAAQPPAIAGAADMEMARRGEKLYRGGDLEANIPACAACHGPAGEGIPPRYPRLSGQYAEYTASSLREYASGAREAAEMNAVSAKLSEEQIEALAAYISGLAP